MASFAALNKHKCPIKTGIMNKRNFQGILGLSLETEKFYCHMGCENFETYTRSIMAKHLLDCHAEEDLEAWMISPAILRMF